MAKRKRAKASVRGRADLHRIAAGAAADAIIMIDEESRIVFVNGAAEKLFGYASPEMLGQSVTMLMPERLRSKHVASLKRYLETGRRHLNWQVVELSGLHKNGTEIHLEISFGEFSVNGRTLFTGVMRDRTERKRLELQLQQVEKLAALGTLLGGVAHELNNPLFIISGYTQLAKEKLAQGLYDDLAGGLETIRDAAQRASAIVNRFLGVARRADARRELCQVEDLVRQALDLMSNDFAIHRVAVQTKFEPALPSVSADPQDLCQVFLNLFTNARQAMVEARGRGTLSIHATLAVDQKGAWVEVRVSDDGPGIAAEHVPRIFEPFYTTKPLGQRTGLGLTICHRIVTDLGGTLTCESIAGKGATFIVRLPITREVQAFSGGKPGAPMVLVAEPEVGLQEQIAGYLERQGYGVTRADTVLVLVRALERARYDALVLDSLMPEFKGGELIRRAYALQPWLAGRTIVLVGKEDVSELPHVIREAGSAVVCKPFSWQVLGQRLREALRAEGGKSG